MESWSTVFPRQFPISIWASPSSSKQRSPASFAVRTFVTVMGDSVSGGWSAEMKLRSSENSPGVAALWARARIDELMDVERRSQEPDEVRKAIVDTAIAHHLVSKYTSLVAVDKTPARPTGDPLNSDQVPNLLPYGQSMNAILGFPATATNAPLLRMTGLLTLLLGLALLLRNRQTVGVRHEERY